MARPITRRLHLLLWLGAGLLRGLVWLLGTSWRFEVVRGQERRAQILADARPVVLSFWHNQSFISAYALYYHWHRQGLPVTLAASRSRDGELVSKLGRMLGLEVIRGSASRGGRELIRACYRSIVRQGSSPVVIPDGPRGPAGRAKPGAVVLAQMARAPILPLAFAAPRPWRLRSWDRLIIPRPFSRVTVAVGEPLTVPRDLSEEDLERQRLRLEEALAALTAAAEAGL